MNHFSLIAYGLERFTAEMEADFKKYKLKKSPNLEQVCRQVARKLFPHRINYLSNRCGIYIYVIRRKHPDMPFNPIKVVFSFS